MTCRDFEGLLDAHFDGELPTVEAIATERHLAECGSCRARYEGLEWLRSEIRAAQLDYAPPASLMRVRPRRRPSWHWGAGLLAAAAALALLLVGPRVWAPSGAGSEILDAHLRSLAATNLVDVPSSDRHTVKPWFQGKLGFAPNVPDLSADGFVLVGGRVEVIRQQRAAALVYKRREHIINVFIRADQGRETEQQPQSAGYHLISWRDRAMSYCVVSDLDAQELSHFAQLLRAHL